MSRVKWGVEAEPPRLKKSVVFERFTKSEVKTIWLLGDVVVRGSHFKFGQNSMPCLRPDDCPFCLDLSWRPQIEGYVPCLLLQKKEQNFWVPCIAVFTKGVLGEIGEGPHRGRRLKLKRSVVGTCKRLVFEEMAGIEPDVPEFDVRPYLEMMWFPLDTPSAPVAELPKPIPAGEERKKYVPTAETPTEADRAKIRALLQASGLGLSGQLAETATPANAQNANKRDLGHDRPKTGQTPVEAGKPAPAARIATLPSRQTRRNGLHELPGQPQSLSEVLGSALGSVLGEQGSPVVHDGNDGFEVPVTQDDIENTPTGTIIGREVRAKLEQNRQAKGGAA